MANILIVEDDATIRQLTAMQLSLVGHQCLEAQDGVQMREQLAACTPDLALLDIMLPGEDGMMLGETLISRGIPVVFVTAKTGVEDRVRGLRQGGCLIQRLAQTFPLRLPTGGYAHIILPFLESRAGLAARPG